MTENLPASVASRSRTLLDATVDAIALLAMAFLAFLGLGAVNFALLAGISIFNADRYYGRRSFLSLAGYNPHGLDRTRLGRLWAHTTHIVDAPKIALQPGQAIGIRRAISTYDHVMYVVTYWCPFVMFAGAPQIFERNGSLTSIVVTAALIIAVGRYARGVGAARRLASR